MIVDPDWVSAVGQAAGALGTFVAVAIALQVALREARAARVERADREAGQARLVTGEIHFARRASWLRTTNHSGQPVFDVEVVRITRDGTDVELRVLDTAASPAVIDVLAAHTERDRQLAGAAEPTHRPVIRFVDARGARWERTGREQPRRVRE